MTDVNLTQFTIKNELKKETQQNIPGDDLTQLNGVGKSLESKLKEKGFITFNKIAECTPQKLSRKIEGVGLKKAQIIVSAATEILKVDNPVSISEKQYDDKMMFDPKYKIDRMSKSIPSQRRLKNEIQPEYIVKEEDGKGQTELDIKDATEYDSFIVEPFEDDEYPIEEISTNLEGTKIEHTNTNELEFMEQKHTSKNMKENLVFNPEIEERIKNLVNTFISDKDEKEYDPSKMFNEQDIDSLSEKDTEIGGDSHSNEQDIELENEIMSTISLTKLIDQAKTTFQSKRYTIILHRIEGIDFLALKLFHVKDELKIISILPVKVSNLEGSLIIANNRVEYYPINRAIEGNDFITEELCDHIVKSLKDTQDQIFWNLSTERTLFQYLKKKFDRNLEIEKTKRSKKLFLRAGLMHYKIVIDPILLCKQNAEFNEKILSFPYQSESNIHFIQIKNLVNLLEFLEQKYHLIENRYHNENVVSLYFHSQNKFIANTRYYSIPFVGVLIGLLVIICSVPLVSHIVFNLSLGIITIYGIVIGYLYLNFYKKKECITNEFATPYHKRAIKLDETDLEIIHEKLTLELMDQFIYECFGKDADFNLIANIEAQKADNLQYHRETKYTELFTNEKGADEFIFAKGKHDDKKSKNRTIGTNYHLFMED